MTASDAAAAAPSIRDRIEFEGRTVLVTGAAWTGEHAGIGRSTALAFAELGADLLLVDHNAEGLERTTAEVVDRGARCRTFTCDLSQRAAVVDVLGDACRSGDGVDVLASVAGITSFRPFTEMTEDEVRHEVDLNLLSHVWLAQLVLPGMLARGRGSIVLVGSDASRFGAPGLSMYCAAKGGVMSLTRSLAAEVGDRGVRVNCLSPGRTDSPSRRRSADHLAEGDFALLPALGRVGRPHEPAEAIVFLASDLASFVTGQVVSVNGGLHRF